VTTSLRIFFIGGMASYRALFHWLTPWILIPTFVIAPMFELLFFAFVGKDAGVGDNTFYLIGNGISSAAIPCLFAMGNTIANERYTGTLGLLLTSPARRLPLFLGRSLPVIINGFVVAVVALVLGALVLRVSLPAGSWLPLLGVTAVASFSCTGLGLLAAAVGLRVRETATLSNIVLGVLLVFTGVNVAVSVLPQWMQSVAQVLPMTHGIEAARDLAAGATIADVAPLVADEILIGLVYAAIGFATLLFFERQSRHHATLDTA
jgi:ABC-2 type transport system permease protein